MASIKSNKPAVLSALSGLSQAMNLRRPIAGRKRRLGDELLDTTAAVISARTAEGQQQPDGSPLPRLKPQTVTRKARRGLDTRILVATGEMLDPREVLGRTTVTSNVASMSPGLSGEVAARVGYAEEGSANRPVRHFYDPGKAGETAVDELIEGEVIPAAVRAAEQA
jgi:hypothetical protein